MTANVFAMDIQKCMDVGMNAHVGQPIDIEILEDTVHKVVAQKNVSLGWRFFFYRVRNGMKMRQIQIKIQKIR